MAIVVHSNTHKTINLGPDGAVTGSSTVADDYIAVTIDNPTIEQLRSCLLIAGKEVGTDATVFAHISTHGVNNTWQLTAHRKDDEDE